MIKAESISSCYSFSRVKLSVYKLAIIFCLGFQFIVSISTAAEEEELLEARMLLVPQAEATMSSQVSGKITNIPFKSGSSFKKEEVLVKFDSAVCLAQLEKAKAELAKAEATFRSNTTLLDMHSVSKLVVKISEADVKRARADLHIVNSTLKYCAIKAPFDGRVIKLHIHPHESVTKGQKLLDIVDMKTPEVQAFVPSLWVRWLKSDTPFTVTLEETGKTYQAKIARLVGKVDAVSQTIEVHGMFLENHEELLSGMSGIAIFKKLTANE